MREMGIMVDDVHTRHVKGPMGALGTQSLVFEDGTTVDLNCKSALMTFNTTIPTMKEVDNLPKYQIAFKEWEPQRYYDDSYVNHHKLNQDKEDSNTKATLFLTKKNPVSLLANSSPSININSDNSTNGSNSLMPTWNDNMSTNSELPSMSSLVARDDDSCTETSNETVTIFSARFFPQHILERFLSRLSEMPL